MEFIISIIIGLTLGSFPTGYILLKKYRNIDITKNGSSNIGAHNSYRVSKSKLIGISVLSIDLIKGFASVFLLKELFGAVFIYQMLGLIGAVFGHCYSVWIKFKGGRGLATAAGGALILSIPILTIWAVLWLASYIFRRNIHFSNFSASLLTLLLSIFSAEILSKYTFPKAESNLEFTLLLSLLLLIILSKHIQVLKEYINSRGQKVRN